MSGETRESARGLGPPLVLLHGIGGGAESFSFQIAHFADRFRLLAWNLPGYGGTPRLAAPPSIKAYGEALRTELDRAGIERAILLGHSIGGMIAQEFAHRWPQRVAAMILHATTAAFGSEDGRFEREFLARRLGPLDAGRSLAALAPDILRELVGEKPDPQGVALALRALAAVPEAAYRDALRALSGFDLRHALETYPMPVLLLAGEHDRNAPPRTMRRMAGRIPHARFELLSGAGHLAHLEQPARFNAAVESFLAAILSGR